MSRGCVHDWIVGITKNFKAILLVIGKNGFNKMGDGVLFKVRRDIANTQAARMFCFRNPNRSRAKGLARKLKLLAKLLVRIKNLAAFHVGHVIHGRN